jgi:hypothetical protein
MEKGVHELIKQEATARNRNYTEIEEIFYSQFRFVAHIIREDSEKDHRRSVKLPSFGSFLFSPKAKKVLDALKKIKNEREKESHHQEAPESGLRGIDGECDG